MLPVDDITQQQQQSFLASSSVQQMNNLYTAEYLYEWINT